MKSDSGNQPKNGDWDPGAEPEEWQAIWERLKIKGDWKKDEISRKMLVWSAHMYEWARRMYEWGLDVNKIIDDPKSKPHRPELEPPPKPPFGS